MLWAVLVATVLLWECKVTTEPGQCPAVNISMSEGSSATIMPNITGYSNALVLRKKNHSSSDWEYILSVTNGKLTPYVTKYKAHFCVSKHGLVVENASKRLAGEYQLLFQLSEVCLRQFFLDVLGSKRTHYSAIAAAVFVFTLVVMFALWLNGAERNLLILPHESQYQQMNLYIL